MSCNANTANCDPLNIFAANAIPGCGQIFNPVNFQAEQLIYSNAYSDLINSLGVPINYYVNTFNFNTADFIYGEEPTSKSLGPFTLQMYVELTEASINLSKFGYAAGDDLVGYLHINTFTNTLSPQVNYALYNQSIEPKSGDLIELTALGCDRPNGRGSKIFEITERVDQDVSSLNPLLGHYVYRLKAKRYEYSFEPGLTGETVNDQVFDNSFSGIVSSSLIGQLSSQAKLYNKDIDVVSKQTVLDMDVNKTDIYGSYY